MKLTYLMVSHYKGASRIELVPAGPVTTIVGENGAGKTSLLDGFSAILGGARLHGKDPVQHGETQADMVAEFDGGVDKGGITVKKTIKAGGKATLDVFTAPGKPAINASQTFLDTLVGKGLMLDPAAYETMDPAKRLELTRKLVGLDFSVIDGQIVALDKQRADAGRDVHGRKTQLDAMPEYPGVPAEEVKPQQVAPAYTSMVGLTQKLDAARKANDAYEVARRLVAASLEQERGLADKVAEAKKAIAEWTACLAKREADCQIQRAATVAATAKLDTMAQVDTSDIEQQIGQAESINTQAQAAAAEANRRAYEEADATNAKVRANRAKAELVAKFRELKAEYERLDNEIAELNREKARQLRAAKFPIAGMGFGLTDITYNGVPFAEASSAERLRTATAMALALAPDRPDAIKCVLIRDGSLLDENSLKVIEEVVESYDGQCVIEIVKRRMEDELEASLIIEQGVGRAPMTREQIEAIRAGKAA